MLLVDDRGPAWTHAVARRDQVFVCVFSALSARSALALRPRGCPGRSGGGWGLRRRRCRLPSSGTSTSTGTGSIRARQRCDLLLLLQLLMLLLWPVWVRKQALRLRVRGRERTAADGVRVPRTCVSRRADDAARAQARRRVVLHTHATARTGP